MAEEFLSWKRPALSGLIGGDLLDGRAHAGFPLRLDDGTPVDAAIPFVLSGPQDVVRLEQAAVVTRRPTPGSANVETTHVPYVELAEPDLPWRYSPVPSQPGGVQPWLALLVGDPTELSLGDGIVTVSGALLDGLDLSRSANWAHVHSVPGHPDIARVLSARTVPGPGDSVQALHPGRSHVAALVPTWLPGAKPTDPPSRAWLASGNSTTSLPCYDTWTFETIDEDDDFRIIAQRLEPLSADEDAAVQDAHVGTASLKPGPAGGDPLTLGGAITGVDAPTESVLSRATAKATSTMARFQRTAGGRWVLGLPRYDDPWSATPGDPDPAKLTGWRKQLHEDPRHRGAAGLGAWAAIAWQDRIVEAAAAQSGALTVAAQRIRHLGLGLDSTRSQWRRRVPDDPQRAIAVLGPMLRRIPTSEGTVADALSGRTAWLTPALRSSAGRRLLRPRTAAVRETKSGARRVHRLLTVAATTCPPTPDVPTGQGGLADRLANPDAAQQAANTLREHANDLVDQAFAALGQAPAPHGSSGISLVVGEHPTTETGTHDGPVLQPLVLDPNIPAPGTGTQDGVPDPDRDHLAGALAEVPEEVIGALATAARPVTRCIPLEPPAWEGVTTAVVKAVDPTEPRPVAVDMVLGGITGLREPLLAAPDFAPELDIPFWSFLKENAPDWLVPGGGAVPLDRVMALVTNPGFVDAFLVGANQQSLAELRRRNVAVTSGWTPLRRFWEHFDDTGPATDIEPIVDLLTAPPPGSPRWDEGSPLGDDSHQQSDRPAQLIVLLHTELFRRYPTTQVYLVANPGGETTWGTPPPVDDPATHVRPVLSGTLDPELVFFGFPRTAEQGRSHWLVLEEPPPGYRFTAPTTAQAALTDSGQYAAATLDKPVRAFFGNLL